MHLMNASNVQFERVIQLDKYATKISDYKCFNTHNKAQHFIGRGWDNWYLAVGWANWSCPISKNELPHLSEIWNNALQVTWPFYNNYMLAVSLL